MVKLAQLAPDQAGVQSLLLIDRLLLVARVLRLIAHDTNSMVLVLKVNVASSGHRH